MLASFANLRPATAVLAQIRNSDLNTIEFLCKMPKDGAHCAALY
jgi:hypothetical protein